MPKVGVLLEGVEAKGAQRPREEIKVRSSCIKGIIESRGAIAINIGGKESRKIYLRQAVSSR